MTENQGTEGGAQWRTAPELPKYVFDIWRKPDKSISPIAIVATVDPDGAPRTAPFGSIRAISPRLLRLLTLRYHDTYANFARDGRVMVALLSPPNIAVSVRGHARVVRDPMQADQHYAIVDIDVEQVKNDMARIVIIETGITVTPVDQFEGWFDRVLDEVEGM